MANEKIKQIKFKPPGQQTEQTYDIHVDVANVDGLLDGGKIPNNFLPSYVDDVIEYTSKSNFPTTGESGKIYVDTTNNLTYRWSGSAYVEISKSLALGETSATAYPGDKGKEAHELASAALPKAGGDLTGTINASGTTNIIDFGTTGWFRGLTTSGGRYDIFGYSNPGILQVGGSYPALALRGKNARPTYNNNDMALSSDISAISVGGRNLIAGTDDTTEFSGKAPSEGTTVDIWTGKTITAPMGTEYIVSFDAKAETAMDINCYFYSPNTTITSESSTGDKRNDVVDGTSKVSVTTEWKRYWVKWTQTPASAIKQIIVGRSSSTSRLYIRAVKLEEGNKSSSWTPAPEDVTLSINNAIAAAWADVVMAEDVKFPVT